MCLVNVDEVITVYANPNCHAELVVLSFLLLSMHRCNVYSGCYGLYELSMLTFSRVVRLYISPQGLPSAVHAH